MEAILYQIESHMENRDLLEEMSSLYSAHYGFWGETADHPGERIQLSAKRLYQWIQSEDSYIATARKGHQLIGYSIAIKKSKNKTNNNYIVSWVTQLVVHKDFRQQGIGKTLLFSFWGFSNDYAWGIMSSNPYAVRALEKATYRRVQPNIMKNKEQGIIKFGVENVSYLNEKTEFVVTSRNCKVNTDFRSDLSRVQEKLNNVTKNDIPWVLGEIEEGWEWFAFTFNEQKKVSLTLHEVEEMLSVSEDIAHQAYSRMLIDDKSHHWAKHTKSEVDFIEKFCKLSKGYRVADFGCGIGRHTIELARRGYGSIGVDFSETLLEKAQMDNPKGMFIHDDCRSVTFSEEFDAIICLYDVIGSFIDQGDNMRILENAVSHLKDNGCMVISVMNYELTKANVKHTFTLSSEHNKLLELSASKTMEETGDIFDPEYYMIDTDTHIIYRREQFAQGGQLPQELIVRDVRYTKDQIVQMCESAGLKVLLSRYVQAGRWETNLHSTDSKAKEILLVCKKGGHNI